MSIHKLTLALLFLCQNFACSSQALAAPSEFFFAVIAHPFAIQADETILRKAIEETDADNLAFVVASGLKSTVEPCTDDLYLRRKALVDSAQNGLILSLATSDWSGCKKENGKSASIERLNRLRDLFFSDEFSFGASKIPLMRQSTSPRFRSYGENIRWEINKVLFATINLPSNNNNYITAAGRNSEFEDRLIANKDWLQRLVHYAEYKKFKEIVLFCDGNPLATPTDSAIKRDGFVEIRKKITTLATQYSGKILLIHNQPNPSQLTQSFNWQGNLGNVGIASGWLKILISPSSKTIFSFSDHSTLASILRH